jgi:hypothetical protein
VEFVERVAAGEATDQDFPSIAALALAARKNQDNDYIFAPDAVFQLCRSGFACSSSVAQAVAWAKGESIGYGNQAYEVVVEGE